MTKEQEESIEYFKKHIKYFEEQIKFIEATDCDYYDEELELYQNRVKQFKTVLSMLKEKDNRIEQLENITKFQSKDIGKAVDYTFELNKEIEEKDQITDLMAEEFKEKTLMYSDFTKEEVKQYFENKAKENPH